ncbi:MAG: zinc-binding alcohol dehydrogenase family protein [Acidobacteria bacterium]|nr:zinc-binding alcohol dehydrogenase family protein [Acidobacteriota bacterium]MBV9624253.1 zinc-binding alcohol dehydrogenase family protein [Acidobacteriota bacterium]
MRALVLQQPGQASVESVPEPAVTNGTILLRVQMVGLCGSDLNSFRGLNPLVSFPRIPGHEVSASVVKGNSVLLPGTNVAVNPYTSCGQCTSCRRGRPNACRFNQTLGVQRDGALTEFIVMPSDKLYPAKLTPKELCLVEPLTVGFHAVARGRVAADDTVAIFGCGGVGLGAVTASNARGARTICIDVDDEKLQLARAAGGVHTINSLKQSLHDDLREVTDGRGPDVAIEAVGTPATFRAAVEEVAFAGRVVYIGYAKELVSYESRLFVQKELDVLGSRNALPEDFQAVIKLLQAGRFPVNEAVSRIVRLEEGPDALRSWSESPSRFNKILITMD